MNFCQRFCTLVLYKCQQLVRREQYRDYVVGVKREFRRISQSANSGSVLPIPSLACLFSFLLVSLSFLVCYAQCCHGNGSGVRNVHLKYHSTIGLQCYFIVAMETRVFKGHYVGNSD